MTILVTNRIRCLHAIVFKSYSLKIREIYKNNLFNLHIGYYSHKYSTIVQIVSIDFTNENPVSLAD